MSFFIFTIYRTRERNAFALARALERADALSLTTSDRQWRVFACERLPAEKTLAPMLGIIAAQLRISPAVWNL